jgi:hypothetical protein
MHTDKVGYRSVEAVTANEVHILTLYEYRPPREERFVGVRGALWGSAKWDTMRLDSCSMPLVLQFMPNWLTAEFGMQSFH